MNILETLEQYGSTRLFWFTDRPSGLRAVVCIDDLTLGPAAGGVRTRSYASEKEALEDVCGLAQAMTRKCALAGLAAGGAKALVLEHALIDRPAAFRKLGQFIEELGGIFRTAGDLGTTTDDLKAMAKGTQYVHTDTSRLAGSVARTTLRSMEAALEVLGESGVRGQRVLVQGCGDMGEAVARQLAGAGAKVLLSDLVTERATRVGLVAERGAAVHATRGLGGQQGLDGIRRVVPVNLLPVLQALIGVAVAQRLALVFDELRAVILVGLVRVLVAPLFSGRVLGTAVTHF